MTYKIGFTGTHGTGKTTACLELVTQLKKLGVDANIVTNTARSCPLDINESATTDAQLWIMGTMMKKELESKSNVVVCDRTLLDVLAYTQRVNPVMAEKMEPFIKEYLKGYSIIFYMRPKEGYLREDGRRSINLKFQQDIKEVIDYLIIKLDVKVRYTDCKLSVVKDLLSI